ncbi:MAG: glycosyltransferase family 4 protein [Candidatus Omnitrophica bacterium]|nr:glycosyltransferase family 4 protein [Candidatus Omnitrophota bacterium]
MKIAFTCIDLPGETKGGASYSVHYLANQLILAGHEVTIFTLSPKPKDALYNINLIHVPFFIKNIYGLSSTLFPFLAAFKNFDSFDILHFHGDNQYIFTKTPVIRTYYGSALDEAINATTVTRFMQQLFFVYPNEIISGLKADEKVVISRGVKKRYPFHTRVVYCGVDLDIFNPGQKNITPAILYVGGSIKGRKRGNLLIKLFKEQIKKKIKNAELWVVCKEKVSGIGIKCFSSNLSAQAIAALYRKAWVLCLPSKYEGLGLAYIEAMASGCAIVSSKNSGAQEILDNGRCGLIVEDNSISAAIIRLIENEQERAHYEKLGAERAKNFSKEKALNQYQEIYEKLHQRHA